MEMCGNSPDEVMTFNRLQRDVSDMLEIIEATPGFDFPYVKPQSSSLEINFNWVGYTLTRFQPLDVSYLYYRFHSKIKCRMCESAEIYTVPTSIPSVSVFFVVLSDLLIELKNDLRVFKTDLFYKVEGLLKSADFEERESDELWVPAFGIDASACMHWMEGFNLSAFYIEKCSQKVDVCPNLKDVKEGALTANPRNVISSSFVFGIVEDTTYRVLEVPLFLSLIHI